MSEFHEMIAESFIWSNEIDTIATVNRTIHCNPEWWKSLSETSKIKVINHELYHLRLNK